MLRTVAAGLLTVTAALAAQRASVRAGMMIRSDEGAVLALEGAPVAVGEAVTIVSIDDRQQTWRASIAKLLSKPQVMENQLTSGPFYALTAEPGATPLPRLAIAVMGRAEIARAGDALILRFSNPAREVRARSCASTEGLHLTLWSGVPLKSQRLWHQYYYAGYDTQPTCTPADTRDGD